MYLGCGNKNNLFLYDDFIQTLLFLKVQDVAKAWRDANQEASDMVVS